MTGKVKREELQARQETEHYAALARRQEVSDAYDRFVLAQRKDGDALLATLTPEELDGYQTLALETGPPTRAETWVGKTILNCPGLRAEVLRHARRDKGRPGPERPMSEVDYDWLVSRRVRAVKNHERDESDADWLFKRDARERQRGRLALKLRVLFSKPGEWTDKTAMRPNGPTRAEGWTRFLVHRTRDLWPYETRALDDPQVIARWRDWWETHRAREVPEPEPLTQPPARTMPGETVQETGPALKLIGAGPVKWEDF